MTINLDALGSEGQEPERNSRKTRGNGQPPREAESPTVVDFKEALAGSVSPTSITSGAGIDADDKTALDQYEQQLVADCLLNDDDGDEPGQKDEITQPLVVKNLPKYSNFQAKLICDLWGVVDREGMDELIRVMPKSFAPKFEEDVDLRRVRFFESVTQDGVIRLVWCFVPEKGGRETNTWISSKLACAGARADPLDHNAVAEETDAMDLPPITSELWRTGIQRTDSVSTSDEPKEAGITRG
jgi:hypothetical protein